MNRKVSSLQVLNENLYFTQKKNRAFQSVIGRLAGIFIPTHTDHH